MMSIEFRGGRAHSAPQLVSQEAGKTKQEAKKKVNWEDDGGDIKIIEPNLKATAQTAASTVPQEHSPEATKINPHSRSSIVSEQDSSKTGGHNSDATSTTATMSPTSHTISTTPITTTTIISAVAIAR